MYRCHMCFYYTGHRRELFEIIKGMEPLAHFEHCFLESEEPQPELLGQADVIFADLREGKVQEVLAALEKGKRADAQIIALADREQAGQLTEFLPGLADLWTAPLSEEELRFRFLRWQQGCKTSRDLWETSAAEETVSE